MKHLLACIAAAVALLAPAASADCPPTLETFTRGFTGTGFADGAVFDAVVWDDGSGPAMYVAGGFRAPAMPSGRLVRYRPEDGWTAVGNGVDFTAYALAVHDDGSGEALYVAGNFSTIESLTVNYIARWDGTAFSTVGG